MENSSLPTQDNQQPTVLVIEDDDSIRELIVTLLLAEDYDVLEAENGELGLAVAIATPPALIVCDIMLPGIDGYGILNSLQSDPKTETIPFLFLTALGTKDNIRQGMNLGADDYLTKPFTTEELLDAIQARLRKHRLWRTHFRQKQQGNSKSINYTVTHDPITQLPNQLALRDDLNRLLKQWQQENLDHVTQDSDDAWVVPIFYLSVDRFERINELYGYHFGNTVLKNIVRYLVGTISETDYLACINYTDFVLISPPTRNAQPADLSAIVNQILQAFTQPITVESRKILINWHVGIVTMPQAEYNFDRYLNQAKEAMDIARNQGKQNYYIHRPEDKQRGKSSKLLLDTDLYEALHREQLVLYYQPKVDTNTGKILGAEALIRWQHPEFGLVPPVNFIPLAEKNGLISGIGQWVFEAACRQLQQWHEQDLPPIRLAINLSGRQFYQPNLAHNLAEILDCYHISANQIELEVTETILISDVELAIANLQSLKDQGFPIAIDDFGTGYSSLSYLQNFPFDILKIDRCFVRNIMRNVTNSTIVKHIIMMAKQLELTTVAEGVESAAEFEFLKAHHCNEIQGYLFSPPVDIATFNQMLRDDPNFLERLKLHTQ
ncbi:response regulator receiver modulated diguanylate cyclase/phosphodiesterase [[Leptolyngbya] sp. PCC 7376]|uniref:putative bifunctional diguanylate cyclase/phosphodiesterase n=1 Tax=[Leptolyngbya] sp. PCC 7376 TaxID=111781 RepID=UPI00029F3131|nr:EAL domain-containing protein [[Leptolyngbya] sp. PCC 7376]AFY36748.1 response regulator receiver modulated diguanylate cyclase/phosphodiesterase [[Leptolyngbya] sp. PCC 7376]